MCQRRVRAEQQMPHGETVTPKPAGKDLLQWSLSRSSAAQPGQRFLSYFFTWPWQAPHSWKEQSQVLNSSPQESPHIWHVAGLLGTSCTREAWNHQSPG